jgi:hypothetical protein
MNRSDIIKNIKKILKTLKISLNLYILNLFNEKLKSIFLKKKINILLSLIYFSSLKLSESE